MTAPTEQTGWTYEDNGVHIDVCYNKRYMFTINDENAAKKTCDRFNRLDALEKLLSAKEKELKYCHERMAAAYEEIRKLTPKQG